MAQRITIQLLVENDAFGEGFTEQSQEVVRIISEAALKIADEPERFLDPSFCDSAVLRDLNGNTVGQIYSQTV